MLSLICERMDILHWIQQYCVIIRSVYLYVVVQGFTLFLAQASKTVAPSMSALPLTSLSKYEHK